MLLCVAAGGSVFLENPASSVMFDTKYFWRFVRCMKGAGLKATCLFVDIRSTPVLAALLVNYLCLAQVWKCSFWMRHYGHPTAKRTVVVSDRQYVRHLDKGRLRKQHRKGKFRTSYVYFDKKGRRCFVGISKHLKKTAEYPAQFARKILSFLPQLQAQDVFIPIEPRPGTWLVNRVIFMYLSIYTLQCGSFRDYIYIYVCTRIYYYIWVL